MLFLPRLKGALQVTEAVGSGDASVRALPLCSWGLSSAAHPPEPVLHGRPFITLFPSTPQWAVMAVLAEFKSRALEGGVRVSGSHRAEISKHPKAVRAWHMFSRDGRMSGGRERRKHQVNQPPLLIVTVHRK